MGLSTFVFLCYLTYLTFHFTKKAKHCSSFLNRFLFASFLCCFFFVFCFGFDFDFFFCFEDLAGLFLFGFGSRICSGSGARFLFGLCPVSSSGNSPGSGTRATDGSGDFWSISTERFFSLFSRFSCFTSDLFLFVGIFFALFDFLPAGFLYPKPLSQIKEGKQISASQIYQ